MHCTIFFNTSHNYKSSAPLTIK